MIKIFAALLFALLFSHMAQASVLEQMRRANAPEAAYQPIDGFMEEYYLEKPVAGVGNFLYMLTRSRMLEDHPAAMPAVAGFMAVQFMAQPDHTLEWLTPPKVTYSDAVTDMLQYAIWLAGRSGEEKISALFSRKPSYLSGKAPKLSDTPIEEPGDIDLMWGAFLASGDTAYAVRIVDAACGVEDADGNPVPDPQLLRIASGGLFLNARAHELIRHEIRSRAADPKAFCHEDRLNPLLPTVLHAAQMDGDFGADMLIANYTDATKLMSGPIEQVMALPAVKQVKPGDKVGILLSFSGMGMKDDLTTDMDYDLTITGPDGKPVEKGEMKKLPIKPSKFTGRFVLLHPASFKAMAFEKDFPEGNYGVTVELHDNIGHKKILMRQQLAFSIPKTEEKKP